MNPSHPSVRQIEYFIAVAETLSFQRAAKLLRVSQPAVTAQIVALEKTLGLQLLERSRSGTVMTAVGQDLLPNARRIMEEVQGLVDRAESASRGPGGIYRLGVTPTLGPYLLPHILPALHRHYGSLRLSVREDAPRDLETGLANAEYDLILTALPIENARLTVVPLFREPLKLVLPADHRLAGRKHVNRRDLAGEDVLSIDEHHHFHRQIEDLCTQLGAQIRRDYEGTSLDTLRHMVTMGMGVAFLPALYIRSEIHRPRELKVTTLRGQVVDRTHALAWRTSSPARQLFREIAHEIRDLANRDLGDDLKPAASN